VLVFAGIVAAVTAVVVLVFSFHEPEAVRKQRDKDAEMQRSLDKTLDGLKKLQEDLKKSQPKPPE
jgi:hypothetical protein